MNKMKIRYLLFLLLLFGCAEPKPKYILDLTPVDSTPNYVIDGVELRKKTRNDYLSGSKPRRLTKAIDGVKCLRCYYEAIYIAVYRHYLEIPEIRESYPVGFLAKYVVAEFSEDEIKAIIEANKSFIAGKIPFSEVENLEYALENKYRKMIQLDMSSEYNRSITVKEDGKGGYIINYPGKEKGEAISKPYNISRIIRENYENKIEEGFLY